MSKIYIIAGEASGDLIGAGLIKAFKQCHPEVQLRFWGGDRMAAEGGEPVRHIRDLAFMGFVEVATHLGSVLGNISFCKNDIMQFRPDAIVYIDYPGFNLKIAKWAKQHGFRNFHYVSPQLWAWKKGRIKGMRRDLDALYYILPFEREFYANNALPQAVYVGHPLLDVVPNGGASPDGGDRYVVMMPGSRKQELKKVLPSMLQLAASRPQYRFVIAGMSLLGAASYEPYLRTASSNVSITYDKVYDLLSSAYAAVVCSGTATLETALFDVPQMVCYRANGLSIAIARRFVGKRIKYISLVNLIADSEVVREFIQGDCTLDNMQREFDRITSVDGRDAVMEGYATVRRILGGGGASQRVASDILKRIDVR